MNLHKSEDVSNVCYTNNIDRMYVYTMLLLTNINYI